jgi:hypothetical protein
MLHALENSITITNVEHQQDSDRRSWAVPRGRPALSTVSITVGYEAGLWV